MKYQRSKFSFFWILSILGFFLFIIAIWWLKDVLNNENWIVITIVVAIFALFIAGKIIRIKKEKTLKESLKNLNNK
jgi:uncharacterized membrane protein YiaA